MKTLQGAHWGTWLAWGLIIAGVGLVLWQVVRPAPHADEVLAETPLPAEEAVTHDVVPTTTPAWVVYISGAVMRPGVYAVPANARVADVVAVAGGLRADADTVVINLAALVSDGMHVHVVSRDTQAAVVAPTMQTTTAQLAINTATVQMLTDLPGIGPALAERIVAYRTAHGDFQSMEDLGAVPGIGPALQAKLAPYIRFARDG